MHVALCRVDTKNGYKVDTKWIQMINIKEITLKPKYSISEVAKLLGVSARTIYRRIKLYGIKKCLDGKLNAEAVRKLLEE